jgi:hypothetical protein
MKMCLLYGVCDSSMPYFFIVRPVNRERGSVLVER